MLEGEPAALSTRLVSRAELDDVLPPDTKRVNASERTALLWERFNGVRARFPL
jgi:hypothetical protein